MGCHWPSRRGLIVGTFTVWMLVAAAALAGTTGKIAGRVTDTQTKEPLIGVSVIVEGTKLGASTNTEGEYSIINIPPGTYSVRASSVGYPASVVRNVRVSVDLTTEVNFQLTETGVTVGEEVVVTAERPIIQRDVTSTSTRVSSDQIKAYPVEDVAGLVNLQAGVVEGHFRGGRSGEVLYLVDGVPVTDVYTGGAAITAETNAIQELEVISGTFNAEYGQAMSGVVNQITKEGGDRLSGDFSAYSGDYVTSNTSLFANTNKVRPSDIVNVEGSLGGPLPLVEGLTFFLSGRMYYNDGYLYGRRMFMPTDSSNFSADDPSRWYIGATGDRKWVPMNYDRRNTQQAKISAAVFGTDKIRLQMMRQQRKFKNYQHEYKYNPEGTYTHTGLGYLGSLTYTSVFSASTYVDLNGAWYSNREESYVFENPYDPRFPDVRRALATSGAAFLVGGAGDLHLHRETRSLAGKADMVSQINQQNQVKAGVEYKRYRIWVHNFGIENDEQTGFRPRPVEFGRSEFAHTIIRPLQWSAYIQDKVELSYMIVNIGLRYDYFNPKSSTLAEQLSLVQGARLKRVGAEHQFSPRIGISYPITERGVLHLSYGHFFQIPQFDLMFINPAFRINATERFLVGNPALRSQRTVAYELGLQQQLSDDIRIDVTGYSKDARNLLGTQIFALENGNQYAQYVNRDYGNTRGVTISFEKRHSHGFSATLDYTFQIAEGNASDPNSVFYDTQTTPPRESQKQLAPLDWDRRHSLNVTATIGQLDDYTVTLIGRLGSGLPYTPAFENQRTGLLNSETRPAQMNVDVYLTKYFAFRGFSLNIFSKIYNIFDIKNEIEVFSDTGRANATLQGEAGLRGINTFQEYTTRPDFYSAPRQIVIGAGITF